MKVIYFIAGVLAFFAGVYAWVRLSDKKRLHHNWGQDYLNTLWEHTNSR